MPTNSKDLVEKIMNFATELSDAVSGRTIPQSLIKRAIGICECMKAAREARVGVRVMRMYAAESDRITAEFRKYGC